MNRFAALTALALIFAAPSFAHAGSITIDTKNGIDKTMTVVEKQAIVQGFEKAPGDNTPVEAVTAPTVPTTPTAPIAPAMPVVKAPVAATPAAQGKPSLVVGHDLPKGLVMDGPGTEAYKKKHRAMKKRAAKKAAAAKAAAEKKAAEQEAAAQNAAAQKESDAAAATTEPAMKAMPVAPIAAMPETMPEAAPVSAPAPEAVAPVMPETVATPPATTMPVVAPVASPAMNEKMPAPSTPAVGNGDAGSDTWETAPDTSAPAGQ